MFFEDSRSDNMPDTYNEFGNSRKTDDTKRTVLEHPSDKDREKRTEIVSNTRSSTLRAILCVLALTPTINGCNYEMPITGPSQEIATLSSDNAEKRKEIFRDNQKLRCLERYFSTSSSGNKEQRESTQQKAMDARDEIESKWDLPDVEMRMSGSGGEPYMYTSPTDIESCRESIRCEELKPQDRKIPGPLTCKKLLPELE